MNFRNSVNSVAALKAGLVTLGWGQIVTFGGKCPEVPLIADFDITKYGGKWLELLRYPTSFQNPLGKCVIADYQIIDETTIRVENSAIDPVKNSNQYYKKGVIGEGYQIQPDTFPNKLYVSFDSYSYKILKFLGQLESNYNIIDTDYDNYATLMSCKSFWFFKIEFGWILGREDIRDTALFNEVKERAINDFGFKTAGSIEIPQTNCTYDFVEDY